MITETIMNALAGTLTWILDKLPGLPSLDSNAMNVFQGFPYAEEIGEAFNTMRHFFVIINEFIDVRFVALGMTIGLVANNAKLIVGFFSWLWERLPFN